MNTESPTSQYIEEPERSTADTLDIWEGKPLAPCGLGMRQQWLAIAESNDTPIFMSAALIWLLLIGREAYAGAIEAKADIETACDAMRMSVLAQCASKLPTRSKVMAFIDGMTRAKMRGCCKLAAAILKRGDDSEPEDAPDVQTPSESDGLGLGKTQGRAKRKSPVRRSKSS